jgi:hypothetical protein
MNCGCFFSERDATTSGKDERMVQMQKMHCEKCGAGASSFECRREHLGNGTVLLVVSCRLCGWRLERDERVHRRHSVPVVPVRKGWTYTPCAVVNCGNQVVVARTRSGFCHVCAGQWRTWQRNRHREPPLLRVNGFWFKRQRLLVPGDPCFRSSRQRHNPFIRPAGKSLPSVRGIFRSNGS